LPKLRKTCSGCRQSLLVFAGEQAAAGQKHIEEAVAVVVDQRRAAAQRFENGQVIGSIFAITVGEIDSRIADLQTPPDLRPVLAVGGRSGVFLPQAAIARKIPLRNNATTIGAPWDLPH
jgi:hypothetical protein